MGWNQSTICCLCSSPLMDYVLQSTNQSLAHRLWRYAQSPQTHCFYPAGFAEEVCEQR